MAGKDCLDDRRLDTICTPNCGGSAPKTTTFLASRSPSLIARPHCLEGIENQKGLVDGSVQIRLVHHMLRSKSRITCPWLGVVQGQLGLLYSSCTVLKWRTGSKRRLFPSSRPALPIRSVQLPSVVYKPGRLRAVSLVKSPLSKMQVYPSAYR